MSEPENFLSRWSRLKREPAPEENSSDEQRAADALAGADDAPAAPPPPLDLTTLPPIESIVADSDIRQFLQAGVPEELTRAALRIAWTADPAIRGFIGIAEYQWDFNVEGSIPGFGALTAEDSEVNLLALAQQSLGPADSGILPSADAAPYPVSTRIPQQNIDSVDRFRQGAASPYRNSHEGEADVLADAVVNAGRADPAETTEPAVGPRIGRSHGGALPQ